ncbi:MAG: c-type cytochrome domain-containing protein [Verrucomicrobiales bacterium]
MKHTHPFVIFACALLTGSSLSVHAQDDQSVYQGIVEKLINTYCITCHTPEKKKGKLIMETYETLMKGGSSAKEGKQTVVPGKSADSLMYSQLVLPKDDDLHMPPSDKPQPTAKEIEVIKWWIDSGAKKETKISETNVPADLKGIVAELAAKKVERPAPVK